MDPIERNILGELRSMIESIDGNPREAIGPLIKEPTTTADIVPDDDDTVLSNNPRETDFALSNQSLHTIQSFIW